MESRVKALSARKLEKIRRKIREMQFEVELREGWQKSPLSPMKIVELFDRVKVRKGYQLVGFIFRSGGNGNGVVWAVESGYEPNLEDCDKMDNFLKTPKPRMAIPPECVLEVDGSAESYLQKSIFVRELHEFGALWHGVSWGHHIIIDRKPADFEWHEEVVDLRPKVYMGNVVIVEFYTLSRFVEEAVYRHLDIYDFFRTETEVVASGGPGYIV